jgi:hypothetical protein
MHFTNTVDGNTTIYAEYHPNSQGRFALSLAIRRNKQKTPSFGSYRLFCVMVTMEKALVNVRNITHVKPSSKLYVAIYEIVITWPAHW